MDVQDIFYTIPDSDNKDFTQSMTALDQMFAPELNQSYERHMFRSMKQQEKETVDQFITRLKKNKPKIVVLVLHLMKTFVIKLCNFAQARD